MKYIFLAIFSFLITGCVGDNKTMHYEISDITDVTYTLDGKLLTLSYILPLETLYYSPGVDISINKNDILLTVKRCNINDKCKVDVTSEHSNGNREIIKLEIKKSTSNVYFNQIKRSNSLETLVSK